MTKAYFDIPCTIKMIIPESDYKITQNDVPVWTRTPKGTSTYTYCWLSNFNTESENLKNILSGFMFKANILDALRQFGRSPIYIPVLRILTSPNIRTPDFEPNNDILAVALFLDKRCKEPTWLHFFEANYNHKLYKRVGESTLKACQKEYSHQGIEGRSTLDALNFYYKYGFKRVDGCELYLRWEPQR